MKALFGICCCLSLLAGGCSTGSTTYGRTLRQWTRHQKLYDFNTLSAELIWHATLLTVPLHEARVARESAMRGWSAEEVDRALPWAWSAPGTAFMVGFYAPKEVQSLSLTEDYFWHLTLLLPTGEEVRPLSIEEVPASPLERKLFPYLHRWSRAYFIRFAPALPSGRIALRLRGLSANSTLQWDIE
ncbi:MAG: hypothetical protein HYV03_08235 [Deltaproteobacteria bacterium]|nr:hypothetical protein [Deltaproteobacteria bacterium]